MEKKQYRKKPVVVEAFQWCTSMGQVGGVTYPVVDEYGDEDLDFVDSYGNEAGLIQNDAGGFPVQDGDWVITGLDGKLYSCKSDMFVQIYEAVEPTDAVTPTPVIL